MVVTTVLSIFSSTHPRQFVNFLKANRHSVQSSWLVRPWALHINSTTHAGLFTSTWSGVVWWRWCCLVQSTHRWSLKSTHLWTPFCPVSLKDIAALLGQIKPSSSSLAVLLLKVFNFIGPCIVSIMTMQTQYVPNYFKQAIVQSLLKKTKLDPAIPESQALRPST